MKNDLKLLYRECIVKWGKEAQMRQTMEEAAELIVALNKEIRGTGSVEDIAEEIADVQLMCEEMIELFNIQKDVDDCKKNKIERLIDRLRGEASRVTIEKNQ
jgi:NTP pyrophosphatase (non-canonical NTP hydrolase)